VGWSLARLLTRWQLVGRLMLLLLLLLLLLGWRTFKPHMADRTATQNRFVSASTMSGTLVGFGGQFEIAQPRPLSPADSSVVWRTLRGEAVACAVTLDRLTKAPQVNEFLQGGQEVQSRST
jgi:hypothetical protein